MSQLSKMHHSRDQWKHKAKQRGKGERYERREKARIKAERDQITQALKASEARVRELETRLHGLATRPKVDVVHVALQLFLEARISFRAVSRVLALLALALGIRKAPCAQTIINWVLRLTIVRIDAARTVRGVPLDPAPFTNGLIWMIDISIGLGSGKILAVLALDAHHHQRESGAPALHHVHCIGVAVADSWTGERIAALLGRLIATMGRPAAYLKDSGSDLHKAVAVLEDDGLGSPCLDDISHAAAGMLKRTYQHHPAFERFVSACGRVSGKLKHTLLACLAPPTVRTKARFMNVHRLFTWADRVLQLSPPGGAKRGSLLAKLRGALDDLPDCKALIKRFQGDAGALMACQEILKTRGLAAATVAQCAPLIDGRHRPRVPHLSGAPARDRHDLRTRSRGRADQFRCDRIAFRGGQAPRGGRDSRCGAHRPSLASVLRDADSGGSRASPGGQYGATTRVHCGMHVLDPAAA